MNSAPDWTYRTLWIIWSAMFLCNGLFLFFVLCTGPDLVTIDHSLTFIGEHYVLIPFGMVFGIFELFWSRREQRRFLDLSLDEQDPDLVRAALLFAASSCISVSCFGVFLAWWFHYPYFYFWILAGAFGMLFAIPKRSDLAAAGHALTDPMSDQ